MKEKTNLKTIHQQGTFSFQKLIEEKKIIWMRDDWLLGIDIFEERDCGHWVCIWKKKIAWTWVFWRENWALKSAYQWLNCIYFLIELIDLWFFLFIVNDFFLSFFWMHFAIHIFKKRIWLFAININAS